MSIWTLKRTEKTTAAGRPYALQRARANGQGARDSWPTPQASDWKDKSCSFDRALSNYRLGIMPGPERKLNPRFSLWLMGYPNDWAVCGMRAVAA